VISFFKFSGFFLTNCENFFYKIIHLYFFDQLLNILDYKTEQNCKFDLWRRLERTYSFLFAYTAICKDIVEMRNKMTYDIILFTFINY